MTSQAEVAKEEWIAALRSGNFRQDKGTLGSYIIGEINNCCLGVYCELVEVDKSDPIGLDKVEIIDYKNGDGEIMEGILTADVRPSWMSEEQQMSCAYANDVLAWTFDEIADWAESGFRVEESEGAFVPIKDNQILS